MYEFQVHYKEIIRARTLVTHSKISHKITQLENFMAETSGGKKGRF